MKLPEKLKDFKIIEHHGDELFCKISDGNKVAIVDETELDQEWYIDFILFSLSKIKEGQSVRVNGRFYI